MDDKDKDKSTEPTAIDIINNIGWIPNLSKEIQKYQKEKLKE